MQTFFNKVTTGDRLLQRNAVWNHAHAGLQRNLEIVQSYYSTRPFAVKSNHLVARLLNSLGVSYDTDIERFHSIVDAKALSIGMGLKMTSSVYRGQLHEGVFYGPQCKEVIFATTDYISPIYIKNNWKTLKPIRVLLHPCSDLEMLLPNGKQNSTASGIASVSINIPALACQYKCFLEEQKYQSELNGINPLTTAQFVHMYVLPNMLDSHVDIAIFNRAFNLLMGAPQSDVLKKHPFMLINYAGEVDRTLLDMTTQARKSDRDFSDILKSFQGLTGSFYDFFRLPDQAPTRQVVWAETLVRLKMIDWLTGISPNHGLKTNAHDINYLIRLFNQLESDSAFTQLLNDKFYYDVKREIQDIRFKITKFG